MADESDQQTARGTTGTYPYHPITLALPIMEAAKECGGKNNPVPKSLLARFLKEDEKGQPLTFKIASAKCYNMIEGRSDYLLTDAAKRYFFPTQEADRQAALLEFLSAPAAFRELLNRFDGTQQRSVEFLGNHLLSKGLVSESWKERVAGFFLRSAQFVGVIDEGGFIRFKAAQQGIKSSAVPDSTKTDSARVVVSTSGTVVPSARFYGGGNPIFNEGGTHEYILPLAKNRRVTVHAPLDITAAEIKRLKRWIEFTLQLDWSEEQEKEP